MKKTDPLFKIIILFTTALLFSGSSILSQSWDDTLKDAQGETVYFNAWGGSEAINDYIRWAGNTVKKRYGVTIQHVKVTDIGEVVSRILGEKSAGRVVDGTVDLMWINGENFKAMKSHQLLYGPFTHELPNYKFVDTENKPTTLFDFTVPVDHMEAPWGMAQLIFMMDGDKVKKSPTSMHDLLDFAKRNPGRFTYPAPPNFYGTTFLKQALLELSTDQEALKAPVQKKLFQTITEPLWVFLDQLHPYMWRKGRTFSTGAPEMKQLLNDGEIFIALSFNPNEAANAIANDELPESVRTYIHNNGTIGNTHFLAIPFNATAKAGAKVFANFLMSPEAQARKATPEIWGDPTILSMDKLPLNDRKRFEAIPKSPATLSEKELSNVIPEPHTSWVEALETEWKRRYSR